MKKTYQRPSTDMFSFRLESQLLGVSNVETTDPKDGGDPTASGGATSEEIGTGAKAVQFDEDL